MANQRIEVEVNIRDDDGAKQVMTEILIDLIKFRLNKFPPSSQELICDLILSSKFHVPCSKFHVPCSKFHVPCSKS